MKTEKNILIAFFLNLSFSIIEFLGGILTNSIAIMSDSIHDLGDAISIGVSYLFEKKSNKKPDEKYTYGYVRYSILGAIITSSILFIGSIFVIYNAIKRIIIPEVINYSGMILIAILGVIINFAAAYFTSTGNSLNQKSVNLHMLEDVLGWGIVLIGAILMKFTKINIIDSVLSILVAFFILINVIKNIKIILNLFLEKTPDNILLPKLKEHLLKINGVYGIHHIHIWSMDGYNNYATMHIVTNKNDTTLKSKIREELKKYGINHVTIEIEDKSEICNEIECKTKPTNKINHHH